MSEIDIGLLRQLHAAPVHLPAGELASQLGVSVADVESGVAGLCAAGFDIESRPGFGFRLLTCPDRLIADDLRARLPVDCALIKEVIVFAETSSTNDVASRLGQQGHPGNVVVFAEQQTSGRGRFGRRWDSQVGRGLWVSVLLRPQLPPNQWLRLTTLAGVAVATAVADATGRSAQIKWPNDVLLEGRKVAGILIETSTDVAGAPFAVIGMGINVNHEAADFPPELAERAGSLRQISGQALDRTDLAVKVLRQLELQLAAAVHRFGDVLAAARRHSALMGKWLRLQTGGTEVEGVAEDLDSEGNLLLRLGDGSLQTMYGGEVSTQSIGR